MADQPYCFHCASYGHEPSECWASPQAPAGQQAEKEPFGYFVYVPAEQRGEFVHDLDDAIDDLTNCECEVTPLYALASQAERPAGREG